MQISNWNLRFQSPAHHDYMKYVYAVSHCLTLHLQSTQSHLVNRRMATCVEGSTHDQHEEIQSITTDRQVSDER